MKEGSGATGTVKEKLLEERPSPPGARSVEWMIHGLAVRHFGMPALLNRHLRLKGRLSPTTSATFSGCAGPRILRHIEAVEPTAHYCMGA
jgi:hypothetical protein